MALPIITISFPNPINVSVQAGDIAYYLDNVTNLGSLELFTGHIPTIHKHSNYNDIIKIGNIIGVNRVGNSIRVNWNPIPSTALFPPIGAFIMFSKDNKANLSNLLGYYAEVQFVNNSSDEAELFSVGTEIFGSSK
jgi:hypothetical protein